MRLVRLHAVSRRLPAALVLLAACAAGLRGALYGHWDDYGALQLPLIFEATCAAIIGVTALGLVDVLAVPVAVRMYGVEIQAQALEFFSVIAPDFRDA